ncbi:hypothetical protein [Sulfitobacter sp. R18_1]|uniref:hypothetical protein n=1 Tax=Sulfitobacter sp. R18_1 TaxID=2821104 RepID=UPI001ADB6C77|nr:hypothetical protein [Sulfitobacter sp. R18_1]MBO9428194.1 hypothetical protein [Sulfitobacter sp. R18_1]
MTDCNLSTGRHYLMTGISVLSLGLLLSFSSAAEAGSIPRYGVEAYCQEVSDFGGGSAMLYNGCIDMEQTAYNGLKSAWSRIPAATQSYCDEVASFGGGSYALLEGCIEMELGAASSPGKFKY